MELARSGDRIVLDPHSGPYRESISFVGTEASGSVNMPLILEGCGAVLDGSALVPTDIWQHYRENIYRFQLTMQPANWTFFHLMDHGRPLKKIAVESDARRIPELEPNSWCIFKGFLYFRAGDRQSTVHHSDYDLSYSQLLTGISLIQVREVRIHDLTVQGFQLDGISAARSAENVVLDNVTCRANGRSGLAIGGSSSVYVGYSTFQDNHQTQVLARPQSKTTLFECTIPEGGISKAENDAVLKIEKDE